MMIIKEWSNELGKFRIEEIITYDLDIYQYKCTKKR